jgi:hypothetical protein
MVVEIMKRKNIKTNSREIYEKFNILNFSNEVILENVKPIQIKRIIDNINKKENVVTIEKVGNYFLIRKVGNINYSIYFK